MTVGGVAVGVGVAAGWGSGYSIRVGEEEEIAGLDTSELGMEAYPEFSKG